MDFYSKICDLIDEGIIAIDTNGYIKVYNKMAKELFGIDTDDGPGCFLQEEIPHFCKDFSPGTSGEFLC